MVPEPNVLAQVRELNRVRLQKQPLDLPSCGSVFKNPTGQKAAQLIEQAGLKGRQIGEAQVSSKHANFIVNLGKATAEDTWSLMMEVKQKVFEKFNIWLETEVVRLGEWEENR
jgi:UDP-N-acetylmuramate dehydrogenase